MLVRTLTASSLFLSLACSANSQFFDPLDGRFDMSNFLAENAYGFLPVPIIITDPAVDGGLGMVGLFFHESEEEKEQRMKAMQSMERGADRYLMPPSVSALALAGTGNESWFAGGGHMGFFRNGDLRYTGGGGYGDVNMDFFGFGDVEFRKPIEINTKAFAIVQNLKTRVKKSPWFVGVEQRYIQAELSPTSLGDLGSNLPPEWQDELTDLLTKDVTTSGVGGVVEFDTRDNIFSPQEGYQYQLKYTVYSDAIGSDIDFTNTYFQGLNFWDLSDTFNLGLRIGGEYANSDENLPPFQIPSMNLRGIPAYRYQGNVVGVAEAQLGWRVDNRWTLVGFTGAGKASNDTEDFWDATTRSTVGTGFRYQIARRYGFNMGLDFAWGPEGMVWYITAGSAWGSI